MLQFMRYNCSMQANNTQQNNSKQNACMCCAVCYNASKRNATAHNVANTIGEFNMQLQVDTLIDDETLCDELGDWWTDEMGMHNNNTMQMNVATANEYLQERSFGYVVTECREQEDGDYLEWKFAAKV